MIHDTGLCFWNREDHEMLKRKPPAQLEQLVPDGHVLARVDRVLDLSWLHEEVAARLMLAGFLLGVVHDRRLMREAQADIAVRWIIDRGLHDRLPDHSSLTRISQRRGEARFWTIFRRTVSACLEAGTANGEGKADNERRKMNARPVDQARVLPPSVDDQVSDGCHLALFIRNLVRSRADLAGVGYCKC